MNKILAGAVGGAAALTVIFGAGVASAVNEYVGLTYEQAKERARGGAVIASRVGNYLPTEKCVVTGSRNAVTSAGRSVLLTLNCNDPMTAGHGGYSAATETGKMAQILRKQGASISDDFSKATAAGKVPFCAENAERCVRICERSRACSGELSDYLGL